MVMMKYHPICSSSDPPANKKVLMIDLSKPLVTSNPLRCRRAIIKPGNSSNDSRLLLKQMSLLSVRFSMSGDSNQPSSTPTIQNSIKKVIAAFENIEEDLKARARAAATSPKIEEAFAACTLLSARNARFRSSLFGPPLRLIHKDINSQLTTTDDAAAAGDDLATCIDELNQMRVD